MQEILKNIITPVKSFWKSIPSKSFKKREAIFFDIDGTIFRSSLVIEHYKYLTSHPDFKIEKSKIVEDVHKRWLNRETDYEEYLFVLIQQYTEILKKLDEKTIKKTAKEVVELKKGEIYTYIRDIITTAKNDGKLVFFISGSPDYLVSEFAKSFDVKSFGSNYIFHNGKFTGNVVPLWNSESKKRKILELTKKYNITLSRSCAYGDTTGDFAMLEMVGKPTLVNPTKKLIDLIKEKNINHTILIERKNVIYELDSKNLSINIY